MLKKAISIALSLCMILTLLPTIALADPAAAVTIAGVTISNGEYYDGSSSALTEAPASGGYAYFKDGTLELHDINITAAKGDCISYTDGDLEIAIYKDCSITANETAASSINVTGNVTITGTGNLTLNAPLCGILATGAVDVNLTGALKVTSTDENDSAILSLENITINADTVQVINTSCTTDSSTAAAIKTSGGNIAVNKDGTSGIIIGAVTAAASSTPTIADGIVTGAVYGGDYSSTALNLYSNTPTVKTAYKAGDYGIIVYTPKDSSATPVTPITVTLNSVDMEVYAGEQALYLPYGTKETPVSLVLNGDNRISSTKGHALESFYLSVSGSGSLTLKGSGYGLFSFNPLTFESGTITADSICSSDDITINGGTLNCPDVYTQYDFTASDKATVNALVATGSPYYEANLVNTVYGTVTLTSDTPIYDYSSADGLIIPSGTKLTIPKNVKLTVEDDTTCDGVPLIDNKGTLVNNGTIVLPETYVKANNFETAKAAITAIELSGDGIVRVGENVYTNDGTQMNFVDGDLDFSNGATSGTGYELDSANKTLTLTNLVLNGKIILPGADYKIIVNGYANANNISFAYGQGGEAHNLTVTGGTLNSGIDLQGNLTLTDTTFVGDVSNPNVGNDKVLTITNSTVSIDMLQWMPDGSVSLTNSTLTAGNGDSSNFWVNKITMDSASVINLVSSITNASRLPDGLDGIKDYLPDGYEIGSYQQPGYSDLATTVLDSTTKKPAVGISIKTQPTPPEPEPTPTPSGSGSSSYTLTFDANGGSAVTKVSKSYGTTIDLSAYTTTRDGYTFDGWYSDTKLTAKVTSVKLTKNTTVYAKWTENQTQLPFTDVSEDDYYYKPVEWAVDEGITGGTSATSFSPNAFCTRAQTVTFLWRANGSPEPTGTVNPFTDVNSGDYYYKAVLWAIEKGITSGTSATTFSPEAIVSRAQAVTFIWRSEGKPVVNYAMAFADVDGSEYYGEAVRWAVSENITTGTSASTFSPKANCTRAQIVTFLYRIMNK